MITYWHIQIINTRRRATERERVCVYVYERSNKAIENDFGASVQTNKQAKTAQFGDKALCRRMM